MADLATVFHWSPTVMDPMSVADLMDWRARAAARHNPES
ncbi:GpE family phage tail protein [Sphingomonas sp. QA11]|nr:GpE family phage tail protein [Sphingomonas sp. QA11]WCM29205.1 GpE family phage tail protein [Sphingomonas sp. QA11]